MESSVGEARRRSLSLGAPREPEAAPTSVARMARQKQDLRAVPLALVCIERPPIREEEAVGGQ